MAYVWHWFERQLRELLEWEENFSERSKKGGWLRRSVLHWKSRHKERGELVAIRMIWYVMAMVIAGNIYSFKTHPADYVLTWMSLCMLMHILMDRFFALCGLALKICAKRHKKQVKSELERTQNMIQHSLGKPRPKEEKEDNDNEDK